MASSSSSQPSSSAGSPSVDSYIGSVISLTSKSEIRYEGVLVSINPQESTIALQNVKSYGTEGRRKDGNQIPASDKVYEYILFRGTDIKDLQVKSSSSVHAKQPTHNDPAIIQSQYADAPGRGTPAASRVDGPPTGLSTKATQQNLARQPFQDPLSSYHTGVRVDSWAPSPALANADGPMHSHGSSGTPSALAYGQQQSVPFQTQPVSSQSSLKYSETATSLAFQTQFATSNPSLLSSSPSSNGVLLSAAPSHIPAMPLLSSNQEINSGGMFPSRVGSSQTSFLPVASMPFSYSSTSGPSTAVPPLLTPYQLTKSIPGATLSHDKLYPETHDTRDLLTSSLYSSSAVPGMPHGPILPLPPSRQDEHGGTLFTEEFDFTAMNEKFNKDEVWGSLGKATQRVSLGDGREDDQIHHNIGINDGYRQDPPKPASKPVYNKDDFFDTLSCNSLNRGGWNGRGRLSERMRLDTETFGEFQHRPPMGYNNYGASHFGHYRGSYNRGRGGYGNYGGRGRGAYRPF